MIRYTKIGVAVYIIAGIMVLAGAVSKIEHAPFANLLLLVGVALSPIGLAFLLLGYLKKVRQ